MRVVSVRGFGAAGGRIREFEEVALVYLDALYQIALRLTGSRAEADDIVQETYLRAYRGFDRFNPGTNCRAWLFTILRNVFLNRLRAGRREVLEADMDDRESVPDRPVATETSPEETFFQTVLHGDIDRALKAVPLVFREAVILADLEGMSYREIAEVLGCPIGTVMSRLSRGRRLLRAGLAQFAREHGYVKEEEA